MRRPTRLGLWAAALLLVLALGGYTAFWFVVAGRIEDGIGEWAQAQRAQNIDLSWQAMRVDGFPLAFRVELRDATLRDLAVPPRGELRLPVLEAVVRPWGLRRWDIAAPSGLTAKQGPADAAGATLSAQTATGSVAVGDDGGVAIWLALGKPTADFGVRLAAADAEIWVNLPPRPPPVHTEPAIGIAIDARQLLLPSVPAPFVNPLDEISFGVTVKGAVPAAPPRQAAASWRDAGGTLELDHFDARWGALAVTGSGTLALDPDLQLEGAFSGGVAGYDQLMTALVAAGRMRESDARLARLALTMLARPGQNGRPEIRTSFAIQNGEMFLGPAKLGRAPRIGWE
jgi:hypothetical protein